METKRSPRIPLVLTWTVLSAGGLGASGACSSSSHSVTVADAASDARTGGTDSTATDSASPGDAVVADTSPADSTARDAQEDAQDAQIEDSAGMDTALADTALPPCFDGLCPDADKGLECEVFADGSAVSVDGAAEIIYVTDGGGCPDGDQVII